MKKFLKTAVVFGLVCAICYPLFLFVWGVSMPEFLKLNLNYRIASYGHMFSRIEEVKTTRDVDILFLGSSHAYRGIDTRIFTTNGFKVFNLGSSSQTPIQTKILVERYLEQLNPKLVLLEVYPSIFTNDGVESSLDIIANDKNDIRSLKMAWQIHHIKTYNALLYGSMRDAMHLNDNITEPIHHGSDTYISGGFVEKEMAFYTPQKRSAYGFNPRAYQLKAFESLLAFFDKKDIDVLLVFAPITSGLYESFEAKEEFDSLMHSYGNYINFNKHIQLNDSLHFYDPHHLNQNGVELFNKKLLEFIPKM